MIVVTERAYFAKDFGMVWVREPTGAERQLDPRLDLRNHSPTGFAWGYSGSGPAQLAFAIICDCMGPGYAVGYYHRFKELVIATFPKDQPFELPESKVIETLAAIDAEPR